MLKVGISGGYYHIIFHPSDSPKRGPLFLVDNSNKPLVYIHLTLPMGWEKSPPLFFAATKTVADLANQALCANDPSQPHKLDDRATAVFSATALKLDPTLALFFRDFLFLHTNTQLLAYVDVSVYNFIGLDQGPTHCHRNVRRTLFRALYKVFIPLNKMGPTHRK